MKHTTGRLYHLISLACATALITMTALAQGPAEKGLKDYYREYFPIGVAVTPASLQGAEATLILKHFNSLTAENAMKMGPIHPEEDRYHWAPADAIVNFAATHGMKMRGHTLCWHNQTPDWLFLDKHGAEVSKEALLQRLKTHITEVVQRYKGKVYAWDVVNEIIDDDPANFFRHSKWYAICGEEFVARAFEWAHAADPEALLFYNDYNTENEGKREKIFRLVKQLVDARVPIHGVGLQGHWSLLHPGQEDLETSIRKFSSLGLQVQVTELDVSIYGPESERRTLQATDETYFTQEKEQQQRAQYAMMFKVFREHKSRITGVTFWNISDRHSWLDNFPVRGRKNYPLLFDEKLQPKKAYWEVVKF